MLRRGEPCLFLHEPTDTLLELYNRQIYPQGTFTGQVKRYTRIMIRSSTDGCRTFTPEEPLIEQGYHETTWARGVRYGENCLQLSFLAPRTLCDGRMVLPVRRVPPGAPTSPPSMSCPTHGL